jgi:molybdenum cofactor guanylyltransferase
MNRIVGVILAGGRGERLGGVIKASLVVGGVRLLERVHTAMGGADVTLVSIGRFGAGELNLFPAQIPVADLDTDYAGPLAGLGAAVVWGSAQPTPPEVLVTAAVDTPFLPAGFARTMADALASGHAAAIATCGGQPYPTNAAWRFDRVADLPARMASGTAPHSLKRLAEELAAATLDWPITADFDPFANVNTPTDLDRLEQQAKAVKTVSSIRHS